MSGPGTPPALAAELLELLRRSKLPFSPETAAYIRDRFAVVLEAWVKLDQRATVAYCFRCRMDVTTRYGMDHFAACTRHPAIVRLRAAHLARVLVNPAFNEGYPPETFADPRFDRLHCPGKRDAERALDDLLASTPERPPAKRSRGEVQAVCLDVAHSDRTLDPCPWCGAVVPLDAFESHLLRCEFHPAEVERQRLLRAMPVAPALDALCLERTIRLHEANQLCLISALFSDDLGWRKEGPYSDAWREKWLLRQLEHAERWLGAPEWNHGWEDFTSTARSDAAAVLAASKPTTCREAIDRLRENVAEVGRWLEHHSLYRTCPACRRRGIPETELQWHLTTCVLHPFVARRRAQRARDLAACAEIHSPSSYLMHEFWPTPVSPDQPPWPAKAREALDALELAAQDTPLQGHEHTLYRVAAAFETMEYVSADLCDWCGKPGRSDDHLLTCPAHPDAGAPAPPLDVWAALQLDADRALVALAMLHDAARCFLAGTQQVYELVTGHKSIARNGLDEMLIVSQREATALIKQADELTVVQLARDTRFGQRRIPAPRTAGRFTSSSRLGSRTVA